MIILLLVKLAAYSTFCKNNIQNHATQYVKLRNFPPISGSLPAYYKSRARNSGEEGTSQSAYCLLQWLKTDSG